MRSNRYDLSKIGEFMFVTFSKFTFREICILALCFGRKYLYLLANFVQIQLLVSSRIQLCLNSSHSFEVSFLKIHILVLKLTEFPS